MKKLLLCSGMLLLCYTSNAQTKEQTDSFKVLEAQYNQLDSAVKAFDLSPYEGKPTPSAFDRLVEQRRTLGEKVYNLRTEIGDAHRAEIEKEEIANSGFNAIYRIKYHYFNVTKWHLGNDRYMLSDERKGGTVIIERKEWSGVGNVQDSTGILTIDGKTYKLYGGRFGVYSVKGSSGIVEIKLQLNYVAVYSDRLKGTRTVYQIANPEGEILKEIPIKHKHVYEPMAAPPAP